MADRCEDHTLAGGMKPKIIASHSTITPQEDIPILPNIVVNPLTGVVTNKIRIPGILFFPLFKIDRICTCLSVTLTFSWVLQMFRTILRKHS